MSRKFYLIIFVAVPLLVIGVLAIYNRSRKAAPPPAENSEESEKPQAPQPEVAVAARVISPILSFDGNTIWYLSPEGKMFRQELAAGAEPEEYPLPENFGNISKIVWQEKGSDFIIERNLAGQAIYQFYSADQNKFIRYPGQMRETVFTADESKIVYDWTTAAGGHILKMSGKTGENFRDVANLARADYRIVPSPVKNEAVLFADNQVDPGEMLLLNLDTGAAASVAPRSAWEGVKFSPDGAKIMAARRAADGRASLVIVNLDNGAIVETGIAAGAEMAAWRPDGNAIFAAGAAGLMRFDLESRQTTVLWQQPNLQVRDMLVHPQEPVLFYVEAGSGELYRFSF